MSKKPKISLLVSIFILGLIYQPVSAQAAVGASASSLVAGVPIPDTSGFSGVPGVADGGPDLNRSRFTYQLDPGQHIKDFAYVSNVGTVGLDLLVYAADGTTTNNGSFDVAETSQPANDVGSWVHFSNGQRVLPIHLKAGASASVAFDMNVPNNASPGDHVGGIAVATAPVGDGQIRVERRVVTRLYARVHGNLSPQLQVGDMSATYTPSFNPLDGVVTESFTLSNTGNVSLKAVALANVTGLFGIPLAPQNAAPVTEIAPGAKRDYTITIAGVGQWIFLNPQIKLVPDVDKDALNPGALKTINRDTTLWEFPTTWFILILIVGAIVFTIRRRLAKRRKQVSQWLEYTEAEARRKASSN